MEGTGEFEMNGRGINDALNFKGTNELGKKLLGLGLERDVPSREPNLLTRLVVQDRGSAPVSQVLVAVRRVEEDHPSVFPDPPALA